MKKKYFIELKSAIVEEDVKTLRRVVEELATLLNEDKYTVGGFNLRQCCYTIFVEKEEQGRRVVLAFDKETIFVSEEARSGLLGNKYRLFCAHITVGTEEAEIKTLWGESELSPEGIEKIKEIVLKFLDELIELL